MKPFVLISLFIGNFFLAGPGWTEQKSAKDLLNQGIRLANESKYDQALEKLRAAVSLDASNVSAHLALGAVALQHQRYDEARNAFEKAVELEPASPTAHYSLAMIYEKFNQLDKARASWERFVALTSEPELREMAQRHLKRLGGE
jgi:Flp pilus assembly protein TadD